MRHGGLNVPKEVGRANAHDVKILWDDGHESVYIARDLRLAGDALPVQALDASVNRKGPFVLNQDCANDA